MDTTIVEAMKTIALANYDPMGDAEHFIDPMTQDEVTALLADAPNVLANYDPMSGEYFQFIICDEPSFLDHQREVLLALLAQKLALRAKNLVELQKKAKLLGSVLLNYSANIFVAAAEAKLAGVQRGGCTMTIADTLFDAASAGS